MRSQQVDAQGRGGGAGRGGGQPGQPAGQGRVGAISVGGTPTVPDNQVTSQPIPRLPDGHVDLTGPWVAGGSNNNMEADAGFKPGELDALLLPWARALKARRDSRTNPTACLPMGVPRVNRTRGSSRCPTPRRGSAHLRPARTGDAGAHRVVFMDGRPHPSIRSRPGSGTPSVDSRRTRSSSTRGLQRQVLGRRRWHAAHRADAHDRAMDAHHYGDHQRFTLDDPGAFSERSR